MNLYTCMVEIMQVSFFMKEQNKNIIQDSCIEAGTLRIGDDHYYFEKSVGSFISPSIPEKPPLHLPRQIFKKQSAGTAVLFGNRDSCDLLKELTQHRYIILLGDAGMGKSTELKWLCHELKDRGDWIPIFKPLGGKKYLADLPSIPKDIEAKIVLVLDGLDESNLQESKLAIENFNTDHPNAKIIVSCRSNAYADSLQNFEVYFLGKLAYSEIQKYTQEQLGHFGETFLQYWREKHHWNQNQLIDNPFFLVHICEYVKDKGNKMPGSLGEVFEHLIEKSFDARLPVLSHFGDGDVANTRKNYRRLLEKLAFVMECRGDNVISKEGLAHLIPDKNERDELISKSSLLELQETNWRFSHNNFQEYLAARVLSNSNNFDAIKEALAAGPAFKRLKWTWINTLSFLMGIWEDTEPKKNQLLAWLAENDLEPLIKIGSLEKDKIPLPDREHIFKLAFESCKKEDLIVGSHYYSYWDMAAFGESPETVRYLMEELKNTKSPVGRSNALLLLRNMQTFSVPYDIQTELQEILFFNIFNFETNTPAIRHFAMEAYFQLFEITDEDAEKIVETFFDSKNAQERTSTYVLIEKKRFHEQYMSRLIHRTVEIEDDSWRGEVRLADESYYLKKCFDSLASENEIVAFFNEYPKEVEDWQGGRNSNMSIQALLEKISTCSKEVITHIFDVMKQRFYEWLAFDGAYRKNILQIIEENNLQKLLFKHIIDIKGFQMVAVEFLDGENINYLVEQLKLGNLNWQYIDSFISWTNSRKRGLIHLLIERLNEISEVPIVVPDAKVPLTQEYKRQQNQRILSEKGWLFDKKLCISTIEKLFTELGKDTINKSEIWEIRSIKSDEIDNLYERYPLSLLRRLNNMSPTSKQKVMQLIDDNWTWISISEIKNYLKQHKQEIKTNPEIGLDETEFNYVKSWCDNHQTNMNLNERVTNGDIVFAWFSIYLKLTQYPQEVYLQMVGSTLQNYLELNILEFLTEYQVVPFRKLKDSVLRILSSNEIDGWRAHYYLKFIEDNQISEATPILQRYIEYYSERFDNRYYALRAYIAIGGDNIYLLDLFKKIEPTPDDSREQTLLDHFSAKQNKEFEKILLQKLAASADVELQIKYARYLIRESSLVGLQLLADYIEREKKSPFSAHIGNRDYLFENPMGIPILLRFFDYGNDPAINQDIFNSISSVGRNMLLHLAACQDKQYFELVRDAIIEHLNSHTSLNKVAEKQNEYLKIAHLEGMRQLRYLLKTLEFNYYQKQPVTLSEAKGLWGELS